MIAIAFVGGCFYFAFLILSQIWKHPQQQKNHPVDKRWFSGFKNEKNINRSRYPELDKKVEEILKGMTMVEATQIVSDYGRVIQFTSQNILMPEKLLPYSKDKIKRAIRGLLFIRGLMLHKSPLLGLSPEQQEELKKSTEQLKIGYMLLDNFVSDESADRASRGRGCY